MLHLIHQRRYFILHAPRQSGKTTSLLALVDYLNQQGQYLALYVNVEGGQAARENVASMMAGVLSSLHRSVLRFTQDSNLADLIKNTPSSLPNAHTDWLSRALFDLSHHSSKPLVIFFDEVDALVGDSLISFLRQLRAGYDGRPQAFPASVVLCGVRDLKDYRMHMDGKDVITGGSAFNIKAKSLRLGNFSFRDRYRRLSLNLKSFANAVTRRLSCKMVLCKLVNMLPTKELAKLTWSSSIAARGEVGRKKSTTALPRMKVTLSMCGGCKQALTQHKLVMSFG